MAFEICVESFIVVLCNYYSLLEDASMTQRCVYRNSIGISSVSCFVYELGVITHPTLLFQWAVVPHPTLLFQWAVVPHPTLLVLVVGESMHGTWEQLTNHTHLLRSR